jgi:ribosomal protein L31E
MGTEDVRIDTLLNKFLWSKVRFQPHRVHASMRFFQAQPVVRSILYRQSSLQWMIVDYLEWFYNHAWG